MEFFLFWVDSFNIHTTFTSFKVDNWRKLLSFIHEIHLHNTIERESTVQTHHYARTLCRLLEGRTAKGRDVEKTAEPRVYVCVCV